MAKRKMVKSALDDQITELAAKTDKRVLVAWACDCVERVLALFESSCPTDRRPRQAIQVARQWLVDGQFRMATIRKASLDSHKAATAVECDDVPRSVARAAGQAVASTHVASHSLAAAIYAATAVRDSNVEGNVEADVQKEREWQYSHLLGLIKVFRKKT